MRVLLLGDTDFGVLQLRQIVAAQDEGALAPDELWVVGTWADRLPSEPTASPGVRLIAEDPESFLDRALPRLPRRTQIIPPPVAHHLFARWLARASGGSLKACGGRWGLPLQVARWDVLYLSAAAWRCPEDCQAPTDCPRIAAPRTWDLPGQIRRMAVVQGLIPLVLEPSGPTSGAEGVRAGRLRAALRLVRRGGAFLIATAAPCHAAASMLVVPG